MPILVSDMLVTVWITVMSSLMIIPLSILVLLTRLMSILRFLAVWKMPLIKTMKRLLTMAQIHLLPMSA